MEDRDGYIWYDGKLVPWRDAKCHVLAHTLQHGMGVFEGVRAYGTSRGPAIFRLRDHTDRLFRSAHILHMPMPVTKDEIDAAHFEVLRANNLTDCYFRPIVFFGGEAVGVGAKGNSTHVAVIAWSWNAYLGANAATNGIRVKTSSYVRYPVNAAHGHAKACGHYINSMLANHEAVRDGYDEALLLDSRGFVAEGSTENLFIVQGNRLMTPERSVVLEGITRDTIMTLASDMGMVVVERTIARDEVYTAEEAFYTGTAAEIVPIRELDGRPIGAGKPGPITLRLQAAYHSTVRGADDRYLNWLAFADDERAGTHRIHVK
jgi:branched-chain amino acid aminotransferase